MIDKVVIRVPAATPFTEEFSRFYREVRGSEVDPFREGEHYTQEGNLQRFGYESRLSLGLKHGKPKSVPSAKGLQRVSGADHRLELMDTGKMGFSRMVHEVGQVFDLKQSKILALENIRVDMCADVQGVPVTWFRMNVRAAYKRWSAAIGKDIPNDWQEMGRTGIETIYWGKRPNCFRVYNKIEELKYQHKRLTRKVSPDAEIPDFSATWGVPEHDYILTRVERAIGGGRIPTAISNLARLKNAPEFNPFDKLKFRESGAVQPTQGSDDNHTYWAGLLLRQFFREMGEHNFRRYMAQQCGRNVHRELRKFARYLPEREEGVTAANLYDFYRDSVTRQIAA